MATKDERATLEHIRLIAGHIVHHAEKLVDAKQPSAERLQYVIMLQERVGDLIKQCKKLKN